MRKFFRTSFQCCWMNISFPMYVPHLSTVYLHVISDFRRETEEKRDLPGYYAACSGNFLPTFQDNLSSVRNYHYCSLHNNQEYICSHLRILLFCDVTLLQHTIEFRISRPLRATWRVGGPITHWRRNVRYLKNGTLRYTTARNFKFSKGKCSKLHSWQK